MCDAMHLLTHKIKGAWRRHKVVAMLFLDVEGAFLNAVTARLLHNMRMRRVPVKYVSFMEHMLTGCCTSLKFDGYMSDWKSINNGIVQGDPLSQLQRTIKQYEQYSSNRRLPILGFKAGNMIWLDCRNIKTKRPSKKLDHRHLGPFPIIEMVSSHAARLSLPLALQRIHPVFHVSLLQPASDSFIPNHIEDPPPPFELDDSNEYEVQRVLDSKIDCRQKGSGLVYLVEWSGFDNTAESTSWEPEENLRNAPDLVRAFHRSYPNKPKPS